MFFQINAFTVGIMKKGDISKTLTIPRPRKVSCNKSAILKPKMTDITIILPTRVMLFMTALNKAGSVKKKL